VYESFDISRCVLIKDQVPSFGAAMWEAKNRDSDDEEDDPLFPPWIMKVTSTTFPNPGSYSF